MTFGATHKQNLLKHSEKREALEKAARQKLQNVIITLNDVNKEVKLWSRDDVWHVNLYVLIPSYYRR